MTSKFVTVCFSPTEVKSDSDLLTPVEKNTWYDAEGEDKYSRGISLHSKKIDEKNEVEVKFEGAVPGPMKTSF